MEFPLRNMVWPQPHDVDETEITYLKAALAQPDWSHTKMAEGFEVQFAEYVGAKHAILVPNGTSAIYLSLLGAGLKPGQHVIVPGITWPSVIYAVIKAGGVPVPVDIDPGTLCMTAASASQAITHRTFGIIPTHLFGSQCDMAEFSRLADETGVMIIEDAAQSIGSVQSGKHAGTWGIAGAYSLNDKKVLACGEGGVIVTDDQDVNDEIRRLQLILPERDSVPSHLPGTYKVSEFQAAIASAQLLKLDDRLDLLETNAASLSDMLENIDGIMPQSRPTSVDRQSYYSFCFHVDEVPDVRTFRSVLCEKINAKVSPPYLPLSRITDFTPTLAHLERQSSERLSVELLNCIQAYDTTSARIQFYPLLATQLEMEMIAETIEKVLIKCRS